MSKQSKMQGYNAKPFTNTCSNCVSFISDVIQISDLVKANDIGTPYFSGKGNRCGFGGFAVKKHATCLVFKAKEVAK